MRPFRLLAPLLIAGLLGPAALNRLAGQLDPAAIHAYARYRPDPYPRPF